MAQVGIGTSNPAASAALDINSTDKGLLPPRLSLIQIKNIVSPQAGLTVYNTDLNKPCFYNGTDWLFYDNSFVLPKLGVYHPLAGGIVIYLDASGLHGLAAAMADLGNCGVTWGCSGLNIPGAQFSAVGTGQSNSNAILANCGTAGIAADLCDDLIQNGFSDWYLPSIDELAFVYARIDSLPGITFGRYWSSTQLNATTVRLIDFSTGQPITISSSSARCVRPIRTF